MTAEQPSIVHFLTDGSLPRFCIDLGELAQAHVSLHDPTGCQILPSDGDTPYAIAAKPSDTARSHIVPIEIENIRLGEFRVSENAPAKLLSSVRHLASTVSEVCENEYELKHRVRELEVLYRLSEHLARASDVQEVLTIALDSAMDVLDLDAGSIVLFDDESQHASDEHGIELIASRNLSEDWLADPTPLSENREFDRSAIRGEIVAIENLLDDERVIAPERLEQENITGFVTAALIFQNRPIGAIRLYDKKPRLFDSSEQRLVMSIAQQAAVSVEQARLLAMQARDRRLGRQLKLASEIQLRMLPTKMPNFEQLDIAGRYAPSLELGGDFYDAFQVGTPASKNLGIVIGDVVGKGMPAALLMASVRSSVRAYAQDVYDIDEIVSRTNKALCRDTLASEFVTLWYGVIDPQTLHLTYCGAGHEPPMILSVPEHRAPNSTDLVELSTGGMVIGVDPSQRYQRGHFDLHRGDVLMCYTDGMTDAQNFEEARFGKRRLQNALIETLADNPEASADEIIEGIFWRIRQFAGLSKQPDDQTLLVVRT
ncbi:MAG: GAF domain-containing protein [Phycisphaera sp.]|nr:MAG: GAF domain-containing protein [Phycisphaera sp.]